MNQFSEKKILIVDDELPIRSLVKRLLSKNYIVLEATDGEEAVNITRTWMSDLVLMDILMPKMDGNTACYAIKTDLGW